MFDVGTRVVCVDDNFDETVKKDVPDRPVKDKVYIVRDVVPGQTSSLQRTLAILLKELHNPPNRHGIEHGFNPNRFRELDTLKGTEKAVEKEKSPKKDLVPTK